VFSHGDISLERVILGPALVKLDSSHGGLHLGKMDLAFVESMLGQLEVVLEEGPLADLIWGVVDHCLYQTHAVEEHISGQSTGFLHYRNHFKTLCDLSFGGPTSVQGVPTCEVLAGEELAVGPVEDIAEVGDLGQTALVEGQALS
jgi:hypothetical protein